MTKATLYPNWQEVVQYGDMGPDPQKIIETDNFRAVIVGLKAGQKIPAHPAPTSTYHFFAGTGTLFVNGVPFAVQAGATIVVPDGATRSIEAETQLAFLGTQAAEINQ
jgi:quercetin dioxygenase-like cupin family protein